MVEKMLSRSVRLMFASTVVLSAGAALAQEAAPQRVEITGSSIKRIAKEGALPVQTLSRKDIEQSGATNVADLVAALPAMQGLLPHPHRLMVVAVACKQHPCMRLVLLIPWCS